jgi:predicted nucleotidyltransferase
MTQQQLSDISGVPLKTIRNWEQQIRTPSSWMMDLVMERVLDYLNFITMSIDEQTGVLSLKTLRDGIHEIANQFPIKRIILFGSYARGQATQLSDVDLYMESELFGLDYFEVAEAMRTKLNKRIDLFSNKTVAPASKVANEIQRSGIVIYER